jgi:hypothetical protein
MIIETYRVPSCQVPDAALKQKNVHLLVAFFRRSVAKQIVMT